MRVIEEFSFDEEPGKTQVKSNITESVEKPNISIVTPFYNAEFHTDILLCGQSEYGGV